ncbi:MAG: DUF6443 domain-containing protein, partial [Bacteroidota bacterium]
MKKYIQLLLLFLGIGGSAFAQTIDGTQNYVRSTTARTSMESEYSFELLKLYGTLNTKVEAIQYFDGLGRPIQTLGWKDSPSGQDMVAFQKYDALGREPEAFLPYVGSKNGGFTDMATAEVEQAVFYGQTGSNLPSSPFPKAVTQFEASPLNRVLEQGAPGVDWQPQVNTIGTQSPLEHTFVQAYEVNTVPIKALKRLPDGSITPSDYPTGSLSVSVTTDENGLLSHTYTDKLGRTLLSQMQVTKGGSEYATTAYAYDIFGRVQYVIQPEGWKLIEQSNNFTQAVQDFAFQYKYDKRGRVIEKKVPGADWVHMVYDLRDRVVLVQDGAQRSRNKWSFTIYDALDRPIMTGIYQSSSTRTALQNVYDVPTVALYEIRQNTPWLDGSGESIVGYSNQSYVLNTNTATVHSVTYYDDYNFNNDPAKVADFAPIAEASLPNLVNEVDYRTRGMVTGVKVKVLSPDPDMPTWLTTVTFYDTYGRELQTQSDNHLQYNGSYGWDRMSYSYNFVGEMLQSVHTHSDGDASTQIIERMEYDHRGRLLKQYHQVDNQPEILMVANSYNELGELVEEKLHSQNGGANFLQTVDRRYNIRGWLTDINTVDPTCSGDVSTETVVNVTVQS